MVDIETLGLPPTAPIVSIGAAIFDPASAGDIEETLFAPIALEDALQLGPVNPVTLRWWLEQPREVQAQLMATPSTEHGLHTALAQLGMLYLKHNCRGVWAKGTAFDVSLLDHAYSAIGLRAPWHYRDVLDMRTLYQMLRWKTNKKFRAEVYQRLQAIAAEILGKELPHNAEFDAVEQALAVQMLYAILRADGRITDPVSGVPLNVDELLVESENEPIGPEIGEQPKMEMPIPPDLSPIEYKGMNDFEFPTGGRDAGA
jgi:exodeoxyribonuclease VIII